MVEEDILEKAREALVLVVVALNANWKIPCCLLHSFIHIVCNGLKFVHQANIIVTSITFDGAASSISMPNFLRTNLNNSLSQTFFLHKVIGEKFYIFLDACHMVKLIKTSFATKKSRKLLWEAN